MNNSIFYVGQEIKFRQENDKEDESGKVDC